MELIYSGKALEDLQKMDKSPRELFRKHIEKISMMPPRRHLKSGLPFNVEDVTKQARMIYEIEKDRIVIVRCLATHKEYEKWYKSFL